MTGEESADDETGAKARRREEMDRHKALHQREQELGIRPMILNERDFVRYDTQVYDMLNDGFLIFWLTYVYGGEVREGFQPFVGCRYLWRGTIVRRDATSNDPFFVDPVILINLDDCEGVVRIPPEVWQFAFEKHQGERELDLNPLAVKWYTLHGSKNRFWWIPPKTTVQVILTSARTGILVKGNVTLLLLLAQAKFPLETLGPNDAIALAPEWGNIFAVQHDCVAAVNKQKEAASAPDTLGVVLEFPKDRVQALLLILMAKANSFLVEFVNDAWLLYAGEKAIGMHGVASGLEAIGSEAIGQMYTARERGTRRAQEKAQARMTLVADSVFASGLPFCWVPLSTGHWERVLYQSWADSQRIARCETLGENYYLNTTYATWALRLSVTWETVDNMQFLPPRHTHLHPARLGRDGEPYPLREIVPAELGATLAKKTAFGQFWTDITGRDIVLIEQQGGWFLFRDEEPASGETEGAEALDEESADEEAGGAGEGEEEEEETEEEEGGGETGGEGSGGKEEEVKAEAESDGEGEEKSAGEKEKDNKKDIKKVTNRPETRTVDVVVKDLSVATRVAPYCGGLQTYLDIFTANGFPTRWFTFYPGSECVERESNQLRTLVQEWVGDAGPKVTSAARKLLSLRQESSFDIDLLLGDLLANATMQKYLATPGSIQSVVNAWEYDDKKGRYTPVLGGAGEIASAKDLYEKVESGADKETENPLLMCTDLYALADEHPEEYKKFVALVERQVADAQEEAEGGTEKSTGTGDPDADLVAEDDGASLGSEEEEESEKEDEDVDMDDDDFDWDAWWEDPHNEAFLSEDALPEQSTSWEQYRAEQKKKQDEENAKNEKKQKE